MPVETVFASHQDPFRAAGEPGQDGDALRATGVVLQVAELGLVAVAEVDADNGVAAFAAKLALDQLKAHITRHSDVMERFARHPTPALRSRLQGVLREAFHQAGKELYALGHRKDVTIRASMDALLVLSDEAFVGHVGHGEVALLHEGLVHRLTGRSELGAEPPSRDRHAPPGHDESQVDLPLLGENADPPAVQAMTVGLSDGDRVVLLGASVAAGLSPGAIRGRHGAPSAEELAHALADAAVIEKGRPRLVGVAQIGSAASVGQDRLTVLRNVDLFKWCSDDELLAFVGLTRPRRFGKGELLLRQGSVNTTLYLLIHGTVGVNKDGQRIARTGAGSIFGEMSMLDHPHASATVEAVSDVEVLTIQRDAFLQALKGDATMAVKVLWSMLLRVSANLRVTSGRLAAMTAAGPADPTEAP